MNENEEKKSNVSAEKSNATEDRISLHRGFAEQKNTERKIKTTTVVHTSGNEGIHIPGEETHQPGITEETERFIKTNTTPFVSVNVRNRQENDDTAVDKYSDRINIKAPEKKPRQNTGKLDVYTALHSANTEGGRMIQAADTPEIKEIEEPVLSDDGAKTKEVETETGDTPEFEDIYDSAPTKHIPEKKSSLLKEIADTAQEGVRRNPDQLMMDGFDSVGKKDSEQLAKEKEEDEILNSELHKTRQKRISSFKFWDRKDSGETSEDTNTDEKFTEKTEATALPAFLQKLTDRFSHLNSDFTPVNSDEYTDFTKRKEVFTCLINARKSILMRLFAVGAIGIALLIIDMIACASADADINGFFTVFGGNYAIYATVNLIALLLCCVFVFGDLKAGLFSLLKAHPKADTSLFFLMLSVLTQNILSYFTQLKLEENFHLLTPAAILLTVPYLLSKLFYYDSIRQCFKAAASKSDKSYLRRITDTGTVSELLKNRDTDGQDVVYAGKTRFIDNFIARSSNGAYAAMPSSRCVVITVGLSLIAGIVTAIIKHNFLYGTTAVAMCLAFSFPVCCLIATGYKLSKENKKLSVKSSFVQDYSDARDFSSVDNLVLDSADIFTAKITNCLTAKNVSDKQAKFCAAVLTSKFGGALNTALEEETSGLEDRFPSCENPVYEERLGLSAWVSGCKVLLGTHTLLVNHNVQVPDEGSVIPFLDEGSIPVYLALEGNFAAVFGVKYFCRSETSDNLRELVKCGTNILLSSYDANINETFAEKLLGMPECSISIIGHGVSEKLNKSMQAVTEAEEAGIVFTDSVESLCRCARSAIKLDRLKKTARLVCEAGSYVSLALGILLALTGEFTEVLPVIPVIVQLIWIGLCFVSPLFFRSSFPVKKPAVSKPLSGLPERKMKNTENEEKNSSENTLTAPESGTDSAKAAEAVEEIKETGDTSASKRDTAEKQSEKAETGTVTEETYAMLDALADDKTEKKENKTLTDEEITESKPEDNENIASSERETRIPGINTAIFTKNLGKAKSFFGSVISRATVTEEIEEDEDEAEENTAETKKPLPFTATIPVRKKRSKYDSDESSIIEQAREEALVREKFTPPDMPAAPHFDLNKKEEEVHIGFVPPKDEGGTYFNEAMFSRFEDDKIFAPLREEKEKNGNGNNFRG